MRARRFATPVLRNDSDSSHSLWTESACLFVPPSASRHAQEASFGLSPAYVLPSSPCCRPSFCAFIDEYAQAPLGVRYLLSLRRSRSYHRLVEIMRRLYRQVAGPQRRDALRLHVNHTVLSLDDAVDHECGVLCNDQS